MPRMMEKVLLEKGVAPEQISVIPLEPAALEHALGLAEADDLLLVFGDNCTRCWKQIVHFGEQLKDRSVDRRSAEKVDFTASLPLLTGALSLPEGDLIQDERGVRIARVEED